MGSLGEVVTLASPLCFYLDDPCSSDAFDALHILAVSFISAVSLALVVDDSSVILSYTPL